MKRAALILLTVLTLAAQRGPRDGIFRTEVPAHPFDVIAGRPEADSALVSLLAYEELEGTVEYAGRESALLSLPRGVPVSVPLENLRPDTAYRWRLKYRAPGAAEFAFSQWHDIHTRRAPGSAFTVTITADSHLDSNTDPAVYTKTLRRAAADAPDFHIDLGDTFMTDKYPAYRDAAPQYLAQRYYFGLLGAPVFLVIGNHDGEQGRFLGAGPENMTTWSTAMRRRYFPNPAPDGFYSGSDDQNYFAWEWGDALFVVLDPFRYTRRNGRGDGWQWTLGEDQYNWLRRTLEASRARHKFVFIHHLVGGAGDSQRGGAEAARFFEWGGANPDGAGAFAAHRPGWAAPIHELLRANHVAVVFHGHDHLFAKQDLGGVVYQEVPQPGFPENREPRGGPPRSAAEYGYASGTILASPGYLRMRVASEALSVDFVRPGGEVAFAYTVH